MGNNINTNMIFTALGDDDIGVAFGGLDKLQVHRFNIAGIMLQHIVEGAATLKHIALNDTHKTIVMVGINKNHDIHTLTQLCIS